MNRALLKNTNQAREWWWKVYCEKSKVEIDICTYIQWSISQSPQEQKQKRHDKYYYHSQDWKTDVYIFTCDFVPDLVG